MSPANVHLVDDSLAGKTVLATLRHWQPGLSWSEARQLLAARQIAVNGTLCQDEARRLRTNDVVEVSGRALSLPRRDDISLRFRDDHVVVVEKPSGLLTELPAAARAAHRQGRPRTPTLDAILPQVISEYEGRRPRRDADQIFIVHRLDRDASGLLVVARTPEARDGLVRQFAARTPSRVYWAIVPGQIGAQTIRSHFARDRGDGHRGSVSLDGTNETSLPDSRAARDPKSEIRLPQLAITHVRRLSSRRGHSLVECRLETGRTNQIRIHLAELGHPICGDVKYGPALHSPKPLTPTIAHDPTPPRLALHAIELSFVHPITGEDLHFVSEWPPELERFWDELRVISNRPS